jgi:hypothetical protein
MKKLIIGLVFAMAAVAFVVSPAMADIKMTTKGYMQVQGLFLSGLPVEKDGYEGSNNWYNMEMVIEPTLHVNDKVRIHAQIRMMERNFSGAAGDTYGGTENNSKYDVWGDKQNNFWLERLYMSFNLWGGTMSVGRMSGGNWANDFGDLDQNRDRILYVRRFGPFTLLGLIEKLDENDGGLQPPRWNNMSNTSYTTVDEDTDAYAIGAVLPFSKQIVLRPLYYHIRYGNGKYLLPASNGDPVSYHVFLLGAIFDFNVVRFETEIDYRMRDVDRTTGGELSYESFAVWGGLDFNVGPLKAGLSGFWMKGGDDSPSGNDRTFSSGTGNRFQPLLLMFSEDMGLFYASGGVSNGSTIGETSGYVCLYAPITFKISDAMSIGGAIGYLQADKMLNGSKVGGGKADDELGWEFDLTFKWKFMDNISYIMDAGYFITGDYFKDASGLSTQDIYGVRNTIKIEW